MVDLLAMRPELRTVLFTYGADLPGEGGAPGRMRSSSVPSVLSVVFVGGMFKRWIVGKGGLSGSLGGILS